MNRAEDWVIRPEHYVRYLREVRGLSDSEMRLPPRGVMVFAAKEFRTVCRALGARVLRWNDGIGLGRYGRSPIAVVRTTIGAPAAALNLEESIAFGLRRVITFGSCGSLVKTLPIGSTVLPSFAVSDEGTSRHYGARTRLKPDAALARFLREGCRRRGISPREGGTWTTDAPYRESRRTARSLARRGVIAVDMETSALYQVAQLRGAKIASLFVVSDELDGPEWKPGFRDPRHAAGLRSAAEVVLEAIGGPRP